MILPICNFFLGFINGVESPNNTNHEPIFWGASLFYPKGIFHGSTPLYKCTPFFSAPRRPVGRWAWRWDRSSPAGSRTSTSRPAAMRPVLWGGSRGAGRVLPRNGFVRNGDIMGIYGVSENSVPLNPMVLMIIIPIGNIPYFSDKPIYGYVGYNGDIIGYIYIYNIYMGLSENVGYILNEIAIFHRENDQQNHWV